MKLCEKHWNELAVVKQPPTILGVTTYSSWFDCLVCQMEEYEKGINAVKNLRRD